MKNLILHPVALVAAMLFGLMMFLVPETTVAQNIVELSLRKPIFGTEACDQDHLNFIRPHIPVSLLVGIEYHIAPLGVEADLTSSHPGIIALPAKSPLKCIALEVNVPTSPTLVTLTATVPPPTPAQHSISFMVYPDQEITSAKLVPAKDLYEVGDQVQLQLDLKYPEPEQYINNGQHSDGCSVYVSKPRATSVTIGDDLYSTAPAGDHGISKQQSSLSIPFTIQSYSDPEGLSQDLTESWYFDFLWVKCNDRIVHKLEDPDPVTWTVKNRFPSVGGVILNKSFVNLGESLQGSVFGADLQTGSAEIQLSTSHPSVSVPTSVIVTGSAPTTFEITTSAANENGRLYPIFGTKNVEIRAKLGESVKTDNLTVKGFELTIDVLIPANRGFLIPGEQLKAKLLLDRPPKSPITIDLESSDPRLISLPRSITFQPGQREFLLDARTARNLTRAQTVQIKGWLGQDRSRQPVEKSVRIQPSGRR